MPRMSCLPVLALLTACASATPSAPPTADPQEVDMSSRADRSITLNAGESISLPDESRLTYLRLLNDSRCPPDKQCIWAGDAEIALRWQPTAGDTRELSLHTNPQQGRQVDIILGAHRIHLAALARGAAPPATLTITAADP